MNSTSHQLLTHLDIRREWRLRGIGTDRLGSGVRIGIFGQQTFELTIVNFKDHRSPAAALSRAAVIAGGNLNRLVSTDCAP